MIQKIHIGRNFTLSQIEGVTFRARGLVTAEYVPVFLRDISFFFYVGMRPCAYWWRDAKNPLSIQISSLQQQQQLLLLLLLLLRLLLLPMLSFATMEQNGVMVRVSYMRQSSPEDFRVDADKWLAVSYHPKLRHNNPLLLAELNKLGALFSAHVND
mmetsp:Transcript_43226/g.69633  ORF Transcript_43226/g.69633 Transcript_43226/m.69633 type:complete len:156 (+) Transcript_43226:126-593(+)